MPLVIFETLSNHRHPSFDNTVVRTLSAAIPRLNNSGKYRFKY